MSGDACADCTGRCCENVAVGITGYDVWRLAKANGLRPEEFVTVASASANDLGAFRFDDGYAVLLLERSATREQSCIFLAGMENGAGLCGTYASRPIVCKTYPMTLANDRVTLRAGVACGSEAWDMARITEALWRRDLDEYAFEWKIYDRTIAMWNASAHAALDDYLSFVMRAFEALDAARPLRDGRPHIDALVIDRIVSPYLASTNVTSELLAGISDAAPGACRG